MTRAQAIAVAAATNGGPHSPSPIGALLPALYQEDDLVQRFTAGLDVVLVPVFAALDSLASYLDPELSPVDFLPWLRAWLAGPDAGAGSPERAREAVAVASETHVWRGTARGLAIEVAAVVGQVPDIEDSGGVTWSRAAGTSAPGKRNPSVVVRVRGGPPADVVRTLERAVAVAVPAHVRARVEILPPEPPGPAAGTDDGGGPTRPSGRRRKTPPKSGRGGSKKSPTGRTPKRATKKPSTTARTAKRATTKTARTAKRATTKTSSTTRTGKRATTARTKATGQRAGASGTSGTPEKQGIARSASNRRNAAKTPKKSTSTRKKTTAGRDGRRRANRPER